MVIIGGGVVGTNAAKMAAGLGAHVTILDISLDRLRYLDDVLPANVDTLYSNRHNILDAIRRADLVIGAVLLPGAKAPHLVKRDDLKLMKPGSVIVDVAVDQGGCVETIKPTTHENPTYFVDGILHYAVANMPGGVPRTSTLALTNATLPYALKLARHGWQQACKDDRALALGPQRGRGQGGVSRRGRGVRAAAGRRRHASCEPGGRPVARMLDIQFVRLPHGEGLPLPGRPRPGRPGTTSPAPRTGCWRRWSGGCSATGFAIAIPGGSSARSGPARGWRSSTGSRCPTRPATIDSDYRGELMIALVNLGAEPFEVARGMRIAQLVFARVEGRRSGRCETLPATDRGDGGFGSTGR